MDFVNDVHLVLALCCSIHNRFAQFADIVHTGVGSGIHLNNVQAAPFIDITARPALAARFVGVVFICAVEGLGEDPGNRGLSHTTQTGKEKSMPQAPGTKSVAKSPGHMLLPYNLGKGCWTVFTGQDKVSH